MRARLIGDRSVLDFQLSWLSNNTSPESVDDPAAWHRGVPRFSKKNYMIPGNHQQG